MVKFSKLKMEYFVKQGWEVAVLEDQGSNKSFGKVTTLSTVWGYLGFISWAVRYTVKMSGAYIEL